MRGINEMGEFEVDYGPDPDERRAKVYASLRKIDPSKMAPQTDDDYWERARARRNARGRSAS